MVWVQVLNEQVVGEGFVSGVSLKPTSTTGGKGIGIRVCSNIFTVLMVVKPNY